MGWRTYVWPVGPLAVGFDDACAICQRAKAWVRPWVSAQRVRLDSAQQPADPGLRQVAAGRRLEVLHAVAGGEVLEGFAAVSALLRRTRVGPLLAPGVAVMEASGLGARAYRAVARRRRCQEPAAACRVARGQGEAPPHASP